MNAARLLAIALLPGCLTVPESPTPECTTNADCRGVEVCDHGTCWGDPPAGEFAIVMSPPMDRPDLVSREIASGSIRADGRIEGLVFEKPVTLSGRLTTMCTPPLDCAREMLQASVTITRDSLFGGGPGFRLVAQTTMSESDGPKFDVDLPPGHPDIPYTVTIVPMPRGDQPATSGSRLAEVVPPMRYQLPVLADTTKTLTVGGVALPTVEGTLLAAAGGGLEDYRVVALGHWDDSAPPTEVSTIAYTDSTGAFRLTLSPDVVGGVEIVARPSDARSGQPTLHLGDVPAAVGVQRTLTEPAGLGQMVPKTITIRGRESGGAVKAIVGARVRVSASIPAAQGTATFAAEGTTDDAGRVVLDVLDGDAIWSAYRLEVVPPASSLVGAIYDQAFAMTDAEVQLPTRTLITGVVVDATGERLGGVTVTARPALRFVWSLEDKAQTFLNSLPLSTNVTDNVGAFTLAVDPVIDAIWGYYDLSLDPARSTGFLERVPTWVHGEVEIPPDARVEQVSVPPIQLPDAAFVHGPVVDFNNIPVKDAEVKVFRANTRATTVCEAVPNAPSPCPSPAQLIGRDAASADGIVELTLPR